VTLVAIESLLFSHSSLSQLNSEFLVDKLDLVGIPSATRMYEFFNYFITLKYLGS
jgi:hypothetical protein